MTDFSKPIRQSSKGILIIFALKTFQFFRKFIVFFIAFGISVAKKKYMDFLTPTSLILIVFIILIIILLIAILKYRNFKFHVSLDDFHLATGIINKDNTIIPKSKIQNVYIKQNWLQQVINVVSVNIETAGDEKSEIEISALDRPTALELKAQLYSVPNELSNEDEITNKSVTFFKASPYRLLLEGVSQNHLKSFAVIASFIFGLFYEYKDYIKDLSFYDRLERSILIEEGSFFSLLIANLILIFVIVLVSMLFSIIKTFVTNYNLEVVEHQNTIEINKGLFNKVSLSLTPTRIQNIIIKTNRIKQYFGLNTISVKQAMVNKKQRKNFNVVALNHSQVASLINKLFSNYEQTGVFLRPETYYKRILWLHAIIICLLLNIPAFFIFGNNFWLLNILLLAYSFFYIYFKFRKAQYQITEDFVTVKHGFIDHITNILEIHKIQSVLIRQSIFQKQKHIASVVIATASDTVTIPFVKEVDAKAICDFLLFKVESQDRDWM